MDDAGTWPAALTVELDLALLASNAARFFVSLELAHDAGQLTRLGTGRLRLDLLRRQARHGEQWIPFPHMGATLRHRLSAALSGVDLAVTALRQAELEGELRLRSVPRPAIPGPGMGWAGEDGPLIQAEMTVTVRLGTTASQWQGQHQGAVFWPEAWGRRP